MSGRTPGPPRKANPDVPERPNILFLFTDQQRFDTIAALGHPFIKTPALDRLVREGMAFTRCYTPSPVCVPARASLHSGRYPWRTQVYDNADPWPVDGPSIPSVLGAAGYRTHAIGKSHFVPDEYGLQGFQSREAAEEIPAAPEKDAYVRFLRENGCGHLADIHGQRGDFYYLPQPGQLPEALHPTAWTGARARAFIEQADGAVPWFLYCGFIHPHPPWVVPPRWSKLYRSHEMPDAFRPPDEESLLCHINRVQNRYKWRDQGHDRNLLRTQRAFYHAAISFIDFQIGQLLDVLDQRGLTDRTLIVFSSDHGEYLGDYGCYGKRGMHDVSNRVPLLARLPGRAAEPRPVWWTSCPPLPRWPGPGRKPMGAISRSFPDSRIGWCFPSSKLERRPSIWRRTARRNTSSRPQIPGSFFSQNRMTAGRKSISGEPRIFNPRAGCSSRR